MSEISALHGRPLCGLLMFVRKILWFCCGFENGTGICCSFHIFPSLLGISPIDSQIRSIRCPFLVVWWFNIDQPVRNDHESTIIRITKMKHWQPTIHQPLSINLSQPFLNPFRPLPRFPPRPSCSSPQKGGGLHAGELQSGASHVGVCPGNATGESPGCPGQNKVGTYWINLAYHTYYIILISNYYLSTVLSNNYNTYIIYIYI